MNNTFFVSRGIYIEDNKIWMLTKETNVLLEFEFPHMSLLSYYILPDDVIRYNGYLSIVKINNELYVVPYENSDLIIVETDSGLVKKTRIPYNNDDCGVSGKFNIVFCYLNKMMMVGHNVKGIFTLDDCGFRISLKYLDLLRKEGVAVDTMGSFFRDSFVKNGSMVYIPLFQRNLILVINIEKEEYEVWRIEEKLKLHTIDIIDKQRGIFLFTTMEDEKVVWSRDEGILERKPLNLLNGVERYYIRAYVLNNKYYYISGCERKIYVESEGIISELKYDYPVEGSFPNGYTQFEAIDKFDKYIVFQARSDGSLFCIDSEHDIIRRLDFGISEEEKNAIIKCAFKGKYIDSPLYERIDLTLKNLISFL